MLLTTGSTVGNSRPTTAPPHINVSLSDTLKVHVSLTEKKPQNSDSRTALRHPACRCIEIDEPNTSFMAALRPASLAHAIGCP